MMDNREKIDCMYYSKCSRRNSGDSCKKCKNNKTRNKKVDYFEEANDNTMPDVCPKLHYDGSFENTMGYKCPVCGKFTHHRFRTEIQLIAFIAAMSLTYDMLKGQ